MLTLDVPLASIRGIGEKFLKRLERLGIKTVRDLLRHFPFRYEDFSKIYQIAELEPGQQATIQGVVQEIEVRRSWRRRMTIVEALIQDASGSLRVVWFNQPFIKNVLRPGRTANFSGKVSLSDNEIYLSHPGYELVGKRETRHTGRLVPIYPETKGLTSKGIRYLTQPILENLAPIPEWIPSRVLAEERLPEINRALRDIHFPKKLEDALAAKRRFSFEDLLLLQLLNISQKLKLAREKSIPIKTNIDDLKEILASLPFRLTLSQKKSLWEIIQDIARPRPMNRLLQGDVGSGKTVVAALTALSAARNGYQTAFMAPTEVLAHQHFETLKKLFTRIPKEYQASAALLTAGAAKIIHENDVEAEARKPNVLKSVASGEIKIIVGTHALIQKSVRFQKLGFVIVDEQHRFGVRQRAILARGKSQSANRSDSRYAIRDSQKIIPHFLSMSATPIPRTLMLTIFGDLDISIIDELPMGRKNIITKIVDRENREKAYRFIQTQVVRGRQAFVICPRIEPPSEQDAHHTRDADIRMQMNFEVKSVKEEYEKLSTKVFPDLRIAMLHGKMKSKEKEKIMRAFKDRACDILVSTSVIEVGVDVPNATVMMIEGSDRFGLAQLYQFRGRVGRGEHQSYCFLFTDSSGKTTQARLKAIIDAKNGFELAEKDLKIRGPGQFLGKEQTGLPDVAMRGLQDIELIKSSRVAATELMRENPMLKKYPLLNEKLEKFRVSLHQE